MMASLVKVSPAFDFNVLFSRAHFVHVVVSLLKQFCLSSVGSGARHLSCALVDYARESGEAAAARFFESNSTRAKVGKSFFSVKTERFLGWG